MESVKWGCGIAKSVRNALVKKTFSGLVRKKGIHGSMIVRSSGSTFGTVRCVAVRTLRNVLNVRSAVVSSILMTWMKTGFAQTVEKERWKKNAEV